ncbi:flavin reductase family protein [Arcobacter porcinus]|uniref:Flavin reductase (DIM6/NTAB) family protein n=1 Tax=Arcobacter porcinus TaxID=1935204 RepID=A0A1C0B161_9BACT|nr:flavin reductase family protein [Arcobacter porcinus]OCL89524.1 Flavin reductase like domain protein [Aliarcobacter thereius]OCL82955.1 Flavin reductase like domain protein [Arcobacter porcinus]OCL88957.1 Flavin reductase like domain protein [Arcobacter porcinus]OCL93601.1 Flavin reductase like domain protein [Arcobacter porcinus]QEP40022.1 flavin reductase (DIM6/NTAB) family protein [Arcobacter porcinus]
MILNYEEINDLNRYKIMSGTIVPRPIAWIVTEDNGVLNAAPFSYFIPISTNPALVIVAIGKKDDGSPKDSLANILKSKKATICFPNKDNYEEVQKCATQLCKSESEIEKYEIEVQKELDDYPPMISSTQTALFCEYFDTYKIDGDTTPVILKINYQYIEDDRINERNHTKIESLGRVGITFKAMVEI